MNAFNASASAGAGANARSNTASLTGGLQQSASLTDWRNQPRRPGEASFFFYDNHFQSDAVKVLPGEYFVSNQDIVIMTVLGSCIAACIWDSKAAVGGMNHFMLPDGDANDTSGRYGSFAMEMLINEMIKLGARRENMQAKVFGGGAVMSGFTTINVGERNTRFVMNYLHTERITVVSKDVLDVYPRKVVFFPTTGKAMVKKLAHAHPDQLESSERKGNPAILARHTSGGSVDLF